MHGNTVRDSCAYKCGGPGCTRLDCRVQQIALTSKTSRLLIVHRPEDCGCTTNDTARLWTTCGSAIISTKALRHRLRPTDCHHRTIDLYETSDLSRRQGILGAREITSLENKATKLPSEAKYSYEYVTKTLISNPARRVQLPILPFNPALALSSFCHSRLQTTPGDPRLSFPLFLISLRYLLVRNLFLLS